jgi:hypothetical protein
MRGLSRRIVAVFGLVAVAAPVEGAETGKAPRVTAVTPIFGELFLRDLPKGFTPAFEATRGPSYIHEMVPAGETVERWTQMITLTGVRDLADRPGMDAGVFAAGLADGFRKACPDTFGLSKPERVKVEGARDAVGFTVGCGRSPTTAGRTSEVAAMLVVIGRRNGYSLQWAWRGPAVAGPADLTPPRADMIEATGSVRLCPKLPGEAAPYPSCSMR